MAHLKEPNSPTSVPQNMQDVHAAIVALTDACCSKYLNAKYADMSRSLTAALCRKRPSPLLRGRQSIWAAAIVYTIGFVNFLFDKSSALHMSSHDLCAYFGVVQSTTVTKSKQIRDQLDIGHFDPAWTLPSKID
jgi:hypothetical protein